MEALQFNLFAPAPAARRSDPKTSKSAALRAAEFAEGHHRRILDCLERYGAQTKDEIASHTGMDSVAVARRISELVRRRKVQDSGKTRPTQTGRQATVWALAPGPVAAAA